MGWHSEFKIHVKFMDEETDPEIRPGTTLKDFIMRFMEDNLLDNKDSGCFVNCNGENMTDKLDYILKEGDQLNISLMLLGGG